MKTKITIDWKENAKKEDIQEIAESVTTLLKGFHFRLLNIDNVSVSQDFEEGK